MADPEGMTERGHLISQESYMRSRRAFNVDGVVCTKHYLTWSVTFVRKYCERSMIDLYKAITKCPPGKPPELPVQFSVGIPFVALVHGFINFWLHPSIHSATQRETSESSERATFARNQRTN